MSGTPRFSIRRPLPSGRVLIELSIVFFLVGGTPGDSRADSIFSSVGFGRWTNVVDVRAAGMGDVSVVGGSRFGFSPRNPARFAHLDRPAGYAAVTFDFTRVDAGAGTQTRPDARLPLVAVGVPFGAGIVGAFAFQELTDARYELTREVPGDPGYTLVTRGEGGWTQAALALARRFGDGAIGVHVGLPFTAFDENILRDFDESEGFVDRDERLETDLDDVAFVTFGGHYTLQRLEAGAFVQLPANGTVRSRRESGGVVTGSSFEIGIPPALGGGLAFAVGGGLRVAGEYRRQAWNDTEIDGANWRELPRTERTRGYKDQDAWGVGLEWQRIVPESASGVTRHPPAWRLGYGFEPWPIAGPHFGRVTDGVVSAGVGIPFREGNGELGLALRYLRRRENNSELREDVVTLVLAFAFARQPRGF